MACGSLLGLGVPVQAQKRIDGLHEGNKAPNGQAGYGVAESTIDFDFTIHASNVHCRLHGAADLHGG